MWTSKWKWLTQVGLRGHKIDKLKVNMEKILTQLSLKNVIYFFLICKWIA